MSAATELSSLSASPSCVLSSCAGRRVACLDDSARLPFSHLPVSASRALVLLGFLGNKKGVYNGCAAICLKPCFFLSLASGLFFFLFFTERKCSFGQLRGSRDAYHATDAMSPASSCLRTQSCDAISICEEHKHKYHGAVAGRRREGKTQMDVGA